MATGSRSAAPARGRTGAAQGIPIEKEMGNPSAPTPQAIEAQARRLVKVARGRRRALILTHDNPDPDSMATALALVQIFREQAGVESTIAHGGIVGRSENRAMIRVLKIPMVHVQRVNPEDFDLLCLVDTQPAMGNHSLPAGRVPDVVLDHHPPRTSCPEVAFADVGGVYGATATIAATYLRALGMEPTREVATALFYGIKADTRDLCRESGEVDVEAYLWLFPRVDKEALNLIEHPRLPADYFRLFHTAIERGYVLGNAVIVDLGEIYAPDMVAEVAERHLALEGIKWALAMALYENKLFLSLRTNDKRMNAGRLIQEVVAVRGGSAGGHGQMAGARIPVEGLSEAARERLKKELIDRFRAEWNVLDKEAIPLLEYGEP